MEETKCDKCDSDYEEEYYKHNDKIYCFECLTEELENAGQLNIVKTTQYYNDDWQDLGTDTDITEVIQNICEDFEIEEIEG